jgi:hypothetical protein
MAEISENHEGFFSEDILKYKENIIYHPCRHQYTYNNIGIYQRPYGGFEDISIVRGIGGERIYV